MVRPVRVRTVAYAAAAFLSVPSGSALSQGAANQAAPAQKPPQTVVTPPPVVLPPVAQTLGGPAGENIRANADPPKDINIPGVSHIPGITPAAATYGLPSAPIVGGPVNADLSTPLSLERAVQIGLALHNSIAIAQQQVLGADAAVTAARSSYFPQVTPTLSYDNSLSPGSQNVGGAIQHVPIRNDSRTDFIAARQLLWDSGRREANVGISRRNAFAAAYGLGNERQNVIINVTQDYYQLVLDRDLVRVDQENVVRATTTRDVVRAQAEVGTAAASDTFQTDADLANAQVTLLSSQNQYNQAEARLKNAMGVVSSQPIQLPPDVTPTPSSAPDTAGIDPYVRLAYLNRLDVKQQQEQVYAQGYNLRLARINAGLNVTAQLTEGYALDPNAGEQRALQISVSYPLFDGGLTRAGIREAQAAYEESKRNLDQVQQNARLAVEQDWLSREQARQTIGAAQVAVTAGQKNYEVQIAKQQNGLVSIPEIVNAQVQLVTAQSALAEATAQYYIADATLRRDIGLNDPQYLPKVPSARPPLTLTSVLH